MSTIDAAKLAKLQAQAASNRIGTSPLTYGGPNFQRFRCCIWHYFADCQFARAVKIVLKSKPANAQDDKKLHGALKKLNVYRQRVGQHVQGGRKRTVCSQFSLLPPLTGSPPVPDCAVSPPLYLSHRRRIKP